MKKDYELKNIDSEAIEDLLERVEDSFKIKFVNDELVHITNFGELCDHIANKIKLDDTDDCTSQQAFYKLRNAISSTLQIDNKKITTNDTLQVLFPRTTRRSQIKMLELHLGFEINILSPPNWVSGTLLTLLLASLVGLFFNWQIALLGLVSSIGGLWFAFKFGNELELQTVGQVAEMMTRENYIKSRHNPNTFNKKEIEKVLTDWFINHFDLDKSKLTREAKFV